MEKYPYITLNRDGDLDTDEKMSVHDKIKRYEMYDRGEIEEEVALVFLDEDLDRMEEDIAEFESVKEQDTSKHLAE